MQYDVSSPEEYLTSLEPDWRKETLLQLRDLILKQGADLHEVISYKMLGYQLGDAVLFHLNAQRGYVSLYCGDTRKIDPEGRLLQGLNIGKGCIRFSKTKKIAETHIAQFIETAVALAREGNDLGCASATLPPYSASTEF